MDSKSRQQKFLKIKQATQTKDVPYYYPSCQWDNINPNGFQVAKNIYLCTYTQYANVNPPKARVLLFHGISGHLGWFAPFVNKLAQIGIESIGYDRRGAGRSQGQRNEINMALNIQDMVKFIEQYQNEGIPVYLFGDSLGGLQVVYATLNLIKQPSGLILQVPALGVNPNLHASKIFAAKCVNCICPAMPIQKIVPGNSIRNPEFEDVWFSDDYVSKGYFNARTIVQVLRSIQNFPNLNAHKRIKCPVILIQDGMDKSVNEYTNLQFYEQLEIQDKTWKYYPEAWHCIQNEPEGPQVIQDIADWLAKRI